MSRALLVGLGNPGAQYEHTRHNVGFRLLDRWASGSGYHFIHQRIGPPSEIASGVHSGRPVTLLKPLSYMNLSGEVVAPVMRYYRVALSDLLVIHDDVDLPLGRLRFVRGGGTGGHKGLLSVIERLGSQDFPRLRIGIGRPEDPMPMERYVLAVFSPAEEDILAEVMGWAVRGVDCFLSEGIESAMNGYNSAGIVGC